MTSSQPDIDAMVDEAASEFKRLMLAKGFKWSDDAFALVKELMRCDVKDIGAVLR